MKITFKPSLYMRSVCTLTLIFAVVSCASAKLDRIRPADELPRDVPKEFQDKFIISETPVPAPTPSASPTPTLDLGKKKKKKAKVLSVAPIAPAKVQFPHRRPKKDPIWEGEKMVLDITWLGVSAGEFTLTTLPFKYIDERKVYHVEGRAKSSSVFSVFYRLDDLIESYIDFESLFSHRFHMLLDESKQNRDSLELHDADKGKIFYWNRWSKPDNDKGETKEFFDRTALSQDTFSSLYYVRTLPLPDGGVINFPVATEGKTWEGVVTVIRREKIKTPMGKIMAVVVKPETKLQGVLQKTGDSYLWLSDDDRRWVLRLEAKVKIGTVIAELKSVLPGTPPADETPPKSGP